MFDLVKEIKSKDGEVHFRRWAVLDTTNVEYRKWKLRE